MTSDIIAGNGGLSIIDLDTISVFHQAYSPIGITDFMLLLIYFYLTDIALQEENKSRVWSVSSSDMILLLCELHFCHQLVTMRELLITTLLVDDCHRPCQVILLQYCHTYGISRAESSEIELEIEICFINIVSFLLNLLIETEEPSVPRNRKDGGNAAGREC